MLSERRQRILEALVNEYISFAIPVGSRTLVDRYDLGVSPATVRNELAELEGEGYVSSPHTSAGRIPTDYGYRSFVDHLMSDPVVFDLTQDQNASLANKGAQLDDVVKDACVALSHLTSCLAVALAPSLSKVSLKHLSFVQLSARRAIIILVTLDGRVLSSQVDFPQDVDQERLHGLELLFNSAFAGQSMIEICNASSDSLLLAAHDPMAGLLLGALMDLLAGESQTKMHQQGMGALLAQPEFKDATQAVPLALALEDEIRLAQLLGDVLGSDGPVVRIGHENMSPGMDGVSVVARSYRYGSSNGIIAVVGPTRMDYARALAAVNHTSALIEEAL
ncbi:MAG: heat-inducible transcription repressor HrcA [Coriobacteriales bacterium]|nr:heat-inducible transcription repressor HrcA [Coriobacteriales bacterium]MBQ6586782.1 heat-inducible transcription repressor HrcA [Coriobacteriales bacterium]